VSAPQADDLLVRLHGHSTEKEVTMELLSKQESIETLTGLAKIFARTAGFDAAELTREVLAGIEGREPPAFTETYLYRYMVYGGGTFPLDMLRYDGSTFEFESDARREEGYIERGEPADARTVSLVRIAGRGWMPNTERWKSFVWRVEPESLTSAPY
jgi:hypothetical protein